MSHFQSSVLALLRAEHREEATAGFPRLKRIPKTAIIFLLDYFATMDAVEQDELLDALVRFGARMFWEAQDVSEYQQLLAIPAYARYDAANRGPAAQCGTRYMAIKSLSMDASMRHPEGFPEGTRTHFTSLNFQPRPDLVPDVSSLKAANAPQLRNLVDDSFRRLFSPDKKEVEKVKSPGGTYRYPGVVGNTRVTVDVDFGSRMGQVCYTVGVLGSDGKLKFPCLYEYLWGAPGGWDYLTEENAPRCIDFLAKQVVYLVGLIERISALVKREK
jgi:hypothetical protein